MQQRSLGINLEERNFLIMETLTAKWCTVAQVLVAARVHANKRGPLWVLKMTGEAFD